jgi:glucose/arabinose dehydrogenase
MIRLLSIAALTAISFSAHAQVFTAQDHKVRAVKVIEGLYHPWGMAFLPDGRMLITERRGTMRIVENGKLLPVSIAGLPEATEHGQGGLLDVALHPKFPENGWVYWTFNGKEGGLHGTEVARGKLGGTKDAPRMTDVQVLFKLQPKTSAAHHFGSRIAFDREGYLFVTFGDRGDSPAKGANQRAQKLDDHAGKSIRLHDDGRVPKDNPFVNTPGAKPEIFTLGNRNMQGAALHPITGQVWAHEHGPQGGDEINILKAGINYGWPVITYGANYGSGSKIGEGTAKENMAQPLLFWVPSIAPSGMAFYSGKAFAKWKGNLFVGALVKQKLVRVVLNGANDRVISQEDLFTGELGRIRDVREGPDGLLYLLTDAPDGALIRLEPTA